MNGKDLFEAMSHVDERYVDEAESKMIPKTIPWLKLASMAACLCLVLFGVYQMLPMMAPGAPESIEDTVPQGSLTDPMSQPPQDPNERVPGQIPTGEVPSVVLYVDDMTESGFVGTVAELVDTDVFEIGMELNVVVADGTRHETSADAKTDYTGQYVVVQFITYDRETNTIVVNMIAEANPPT